MVCTTCDREASEKAAAQARFNEAARELREAMRTATVRLNILVGRMRACHLETGKHELLSEAEAFHAEAVEALMSYDKALKESGGG